MQLFAISSGYSYLSSVVLRNESPSRCDLVAGRKTNYLRRQNSRRCSGHIKSFAVASKQAESLISPGMVIFCILNKKIKATGWVPRSLSGWIGAADYCTVTVTLNG